MAVYLYQCNLCGRRFEATQGMTEAKLTECPLVHRELRLPCGGPVRRLIQPAGIAFKGAGFHRNDYPSRR